MLQVQDVKGFLPMLVTYTVNDLKYQTMVYVDSSTGDVRDVETSTPFHALSEEFKKAILNHIAVKTPPLIVPPVPEKPFYNSGSYTF
jgi:hypothetical protein